jgi:hypothetical protein
MANSRGHRAALCSAAFGVILGSFGVGQAAPDATGKGIAGGALLGAELTIFGEAIAGLERPWLYWIGASAGAVGGGLGGYYVESSGAPSSSYYLLAGGMALSIPAMIVYLDATNEARHSLPETDSEIGPDYDGEPLDELDEARAKVAPDVAQLTLPRRDRARSAGLTRGVSPSPRELRLSGAVDFDQGWHLRPPVWIAAPVHSPFELSELGASGGTQVLVYLLSGAF